MKELATAAEHRAFLLAASAWQDTLLQSYRSFHVTIQGFLVAASSAVLAVQLTGAVQDQSSSSSSGMLFNAVFTALLGFLFWLQRKTADELRGVVASRAADINLWHKATILAENELEPSQRIFTYFKMWQHANRADVQHLLPLYLPAEGISESAVDELIGKGMGHTRRVLDLNLFARVRLLSISIVFASVVITLWFGLRWWQALPYPTTGS